MRRCRLRLNGIDAPKTGQPYGKNARQWLANAVGNRFVTVTITDTDRYGRTIAAIRYGARLINDRMVREGLAWHYVQYAPNWKDLKSAE